MSRAGDGAAPLRVACLIDLVAPYRVDFFNALAARSDVDLRVFACASREPDRDLQSATPHAFALDLAPGVQWRNRHTGRTRFVALGALRRIVAWRPDVVVAGMTTLLAAAGAVAARLAGARFIWWVDVTSRVDQRLSHAALNPLKVALSRAAAVTVASSRAAGAWAVACGAPRQRVVVVPIAIDSAAFAARVEAARAAAAPPALGAGVRQPVVLYCGRLERHKGVFELLAAFAAAAGDGGHGTLVMVGDGSLASELRCRATAAGVRLVLAGLRQPVELPACYAAADVFCLLSDYDCFGAVVAEAAAAGLPLLVSRHAGAVDHLVEDGSNGWPVEPTDTAGVAARLRALMADPERCRQMGAASRRIALANGVEPSVAAFVAALARARGVR